MESEKENEDGKIEEDEDDSDSDLDDDLSDDEDEYDKTLLENYNSCIDENDEVDEFVIFRDTLQGNIVFIRLVIENKKCIFFWL